MKLRPDCFAIMMALIYEQDKEIQIIFENHL